MQRRIPDIRDPARVPDNAQLLDVQQVATILSLGVSTVRRWRDMGKLPPAINLHGRVRWRRSDILNYIDALD